MYCRHGVYAFYVYCCVSYFGEITNLWLLIMDYNVSRTSEDHGKAKA